MMEIKSFFMNEIHNLRRKISSLQLKIQQEKIDQSGNNNFCGKRERLFIEDLRKTKLDSNQCENELLKHKMIAKQRTIETFSIK